MGVATWGAIAHFEKREGECLKRKGEDAVAETRRPSLDELYGLHGRPLFGMAMRMLRAREDAEEAVQDVFLAWFRNPPELPADATGAWLRRSLANRCIDRLRRGKRWRLTEVADRHLQPVRPEPGKGIDLERALETLPENARRVFQLHDVEGFPHREVAEILGIQVGTSKSQLSRARRLLRDSLTAEA